MLSTFLSIFIYCFITQGDHETSFSYVLVMTVPGEGLMCLSMSLCFFYTCNEWKMWQTWQWGMNKGCFEINWQKNLIHFCCGILISVDSFLEVFHYTCKRWCLRLVTGYETIQNKYIIKEKKKKKTVKLSTNYHQIADGGKGGREEDIYSIFDCLRTGSHT